MSQDNTHSPIGWIGAGRMGSAMARRLLGAGYELHITNRTRAKAELLVPDGARVVDHPRDLGGCEVVFVMVSASADLEEVMTGPTGLLSGEGPFPRVIVDSSTVSSTTSALIRVEAAKRGAHFLAAPVSGNPKVVRSGKLTLAVSGPEEAFREVESVLGHLGQGVTYVGNDELARLVKICHNIFLGIVTQSLAEITVLAEAGGVKRSAFLDFLNNSVMGSVFTRYKSPAFVNLDFTPTFTPVLLRKDFDLGMSVAKEMRVPMPLAALCSEIVLSSIGAGYSERDFAVLLLEQARSAGLDIEAEGIDIADGLDSDGS